MLIRRRRRHQQQRGQILILALAFIAFFGIVVLAVLGFASATALQHKHTEITAQTDAAGEGGAAYAAADAARNNPAVDWCSAGANTAPGADWGTVTMADGKSTTANYSLVKCDPGQTATTVAAQGHCLLCILNQTGFGTTVKHDPTTRVFSAQCASGGGGGLSSAYCLTTNGGDDYLNGSIGGSPNSRQLKACEAAGVCPGLAKIALLDAGSSGGGTWPSGCCTPTPTGSNFTSPISDPLASIGDPSAAGVSLPTGCTNWQTCKPENCQGTAGVTQGTWSATRGCSITLSINQPTSYRLYPGVWNSISVSGQASVELEPGVYVLTGAFTNSGLGIICAPGTISGASCAPSAGAGVSLYLACNGAGSASPVAFMACPSSGASGGSISFTGGGNASTQVTLNATSCPSSQELPQWQCPGYDGVALLADPNLTDPSTSACITGAAGSCAVAVSGNGGSINGSVDTRSAGMAIAGGGNDAINAGFLIANSLSIQVSGSSGTGMQLSGPGTFTATGNGCSVLALNVYSATPPSPAPAPAQMPTAVLQLPQCGTNKLSGIVYFNYVP